MYKITLVWTLLLLMLPGLKAQDSSFAYFDSLTYTLYEKGNYRELKAAGNDALHYGYDYYYLRMRLGIAAYEQKHYRTAASHFAKASTFYNNNLVKEYSYYSNLWGGNTITAREVASTMPDSLRKRLKISNSALLSADADVGYLSLNGSYPDDVSFPKEEGFQIIPGTFTTTDIEISHKAGKRVVLTHQFTYLHRSSKKYAYDAGYQFIDSTYKTNQYQYYLGSTIVFGKNRILNVGGHVAAVNYPFFIKEDNPDSLVYRSTSKWATDYLVSTSLLKNFNRFSLEAEMVVMRMTGKWVYQPSAIVRLYPFANLNFYTQSQLSWLIKDSGGLFFQQKIGFKVFKYLWLEGDYFTGNVSGFSLQNGAVIFNGLETINSMWGAKAIVPATSRFLFTFGYQNRKQTNYFFDAHGAALKSSAIKLDYSLLYLSLQWKF